MLAEQKIRMFLEVYNSEDKIHARVLKMMLESLDGQSCVLNAADELIKNSTNVKNLEILKKKLKENTEIALLNSSSAPLFSVNPNLDLKIANYLAQSPLADSSRLPETFYDVQCENKNLGSEKILDNRNSEDKHKRLKLNDQEPSDDSLISIPGINDDFKDDFSELAYPPAKNELNYLEPNFLFHHNDRPRNIYFSGTSRDDFKSTNSIKSNIKNDETPAFDFPQSKEASRGVQNERIAPGPKLDFSDCVSVFPENSTVNKDDLENDYVFYNNILSTPESGITKPRDPYYLYPVLQCKLCGLRFFKDSTDEFGLHIEDHRRKTKALGERIVLRREFFNLKPKIKIEKLDLAFEGDTEFLVWTKEPPTCVVCKKIIKKIWAEDLENWILDSGAEINEKEVAHKKCIV